MCRILAEADDWRGPDEVRRWLDAVWQARFTAEDVGELLITWHRGRGDVVTGAGGGWSLPYSLASIL